MSATLQKKVLVLNKSWVAVGSISLKRAITLVFSTYKDGESKAKIVDPVNDFQLFTWNDWSQFIPKDDEDSISSSNFVFRVPEIIVLGRYNKLPNRKVYFNRRNLYRRDNFTCQYCERKLDSSELTIDHIIPSSRGGKSNWTNCVLACNKCNAKKGSSLLSEIGLRLMRKPFKPKFNMLDVDVKIKSWEHFLGEAYWNVELK